MLVLHVDEENHDLAIRFQNYKGQSHLPCLKSQDNMIHAKNDNAKKVHYGGKATEGGFRGTSQWDWFRGHRSL